MTNLQESSQLSADREFVLLVDALKKKARMTGGSAQQLLQAIMSPSREHIQALQRSDSESCEIVFEAMRKQPQTARTRIKSFVAMCVCGRTDLAEGMLGHPDEEGTLWEETGDALDAAVRFLIQARGVNITVPGV
jgi:hypothetical protein